MYQTLYGAKRKGFIDSDIEIYHYSIPKINILNKIHMKLDIIQKWRQRLEVLCEQMRLNKLDIENLLFFLTY